MNSEKKYNFVRFYSDHTPLFFDLLREKILDHLSFNFVFSFRRVCKSFHKLITQHHVIKRSFIPFAFRSVGNDSGKVLENETISSVLQNLKFRSYEFGSADVNLLKDFLHPSFNRADERHAYDLENLSITLAEDITDSLFSSEYRNLENIRRYRSIQTLNVLISLRTILRNNVMNRTPNQLDPFSGLEAVLRETKIHRLSLTGFKITKDFIDLFQTSSLSAQASILPKSLWLEMHFESNFTFLRNFDETIGKFLSSVNVEELIFSFRIRIQPHALPIIEKIITSLSENTHIKDTRLLRNGKRVRLKIERFKQYAMNHSIERINNPVRCRGGIEIFELAEFVEKHQLLQRVGMIIMWKDLFRENLKNIIRSLKRLFEVKNRQIDEIVFKSALTKKNNNNKEQLRSVFFGEDYKPSSSMNNIFEVEFVVCTNPVEEKRVTFDMIRNFIYPIRDSLKMFPNVRFSLKFYSIGRGANDLYVDTVNGLLKELFCHHGLVNYRPWVRFL